MTRQLKPCGTLAAARRHLRNGEKVCEACRAAEVQSRRDKGIKPQRIAEHGTGSKYKSGCRCDECTKANSRGSAKFRASHRDLPPDQIPHGLNGYRNYGCRCQVCRTANTTECRNYRAARRRAKEGGAA